MVLGPFFFFFSFHHFIFHFLFHAWSVEYQGKATNRHWVVARACNGGQRGRTQGLDLVRAHDGGWLGMILHFHFFIFSSFSFSFLGPGLTVPIFLRLSFITCILCCYIWCNIFVFLALCWSHMYHLIYRYLPSHLWSCIIFFFLSVLLYLM